MNLADMLSYTDIHQLSTIATNYDCECSSHSKNELIQAILSKINRREVFEKHIHNMREDDLRFINSLVFDTRSSFSLEELIARVQQSKMVKEESDTHNPRDVISAFKKRGWLFNGYSQQTKYLLHVPDDLKRRIGDALTRQFLNSIEAVEEPDVYREEHRLMADDVKRFIGFTAGHEILLNMEGSMYKKHVQQIMELFAVQEEPIGKTGWRFGYGRRFKEYPNRFSLIYDFCFYQGLIEENGQLLLVTDEGHELLQNGKGGETLDLYRFWLRLYKGAIPNLPVLVRWISLLAGEWVTFDSLSQVMKQFVKPYYYDSPESILETRIVGMMMHLGLLKVGEDHDKGKVIRMTKQGISLIGGIMIEENDKIDIPVDIF